MTSPDVCVAENCQAPFMNDTSQGLGANAPGDARTRTGAGLLWANAPVQLYSLLLATAISGGGMPPSPPGSAPAGLAGLWCKLESLVHEARCCLVADYDTGEDPAPAATATAHWPQRRRRLRATAAATATAAAAASCRPAAWPHPRCSRGCRRLRRLARSCPHAS